MQTVMIYDQCGERALEFYIFDADLRHLDAVYLNDIVSPIGKRRELDNLMYDSEGNTKVRPVCKEDIVKGILMGACLIVCGFK